MRVNHPIFTGAVLCYATLLLPNSALANDAVEGKILTGGDASVPPSELILGAPFPAPLKPMLARRELQMHPVPSPWQGLAATPAFTRATAMPEVPAGTHIATVPQDSTNTTIEQAVSGNTTPPAPDSPLVLDALLVTAERVAGDAGLSGLLGSRDQSIQDEGVEAGLNTGSSKECEGFCTYGEKADGEILANDIARSLPSLEEIQQIQQELQDLELNRTEAPAFRRAVFPSISISNPTGYGADRGQIYAGIGYQSRTRTSGGTFFGGGRSDAVAGVGFGIGNARESVGLQVSYTAASFGGSRSPLSGGLNAKLHKQFGNGLAAAIGGEGIINFGRLPEGINGEVEFNDFEGTYYGTLTYTFPLRQNYSAPFSRLSITGGVGSGRFRTSEQIVNGDFALGVFGSAALQVHPSTNLITEWTGQDLAVGASIAPFPNFPIVLTPAVRDLVGESDGSPRFVLGVGVSIKDLFSRSGL